MWGEGEWIIKWCSPVVNRFRIDGSATRLNNDVIWRLLRHLSMFYKIERKGLSFVESIAFIVIYAIFHTFFSHVLSINKDFIFRAMTRVGRELV